MHFILSTSSQFKNLTCTYKNCISGKISYQQKLTCQLIYSFLGADERAETKRLEIKRKRNEMKRMPIYANKNHKMILNKG